MSESSRSRSSLLATLLLAILVALGAGCGNQADNDSGFVFTGSAGAAPNTGNLLFQFISPQATAVPNETGTLRFDLYDGENGNGTLVFTQSTAFATSITLSKVPDDVRSVVITAFNADSFPLGTLAINVTVNANDTTQVELSGANFIAVTVSSLSATPDPLSIDVGGTGTSTLQAFFSNSSSSAIPAGEANYTVVNGALANVSASGVFTGVSAGNTTVNITYSFNGSQTDTSASLVVNSVPK